MSILLLVATLRPPRPRRGGRLPSLICLMALSEITWTYSLTSTMLRFSRALISRTCPTDPSVLAPPPSPRRECYAPVIQGVFYVVPLDVTRQLLHCSTAPGFIINTPLRYNFLTSQWIRIIICFRSDNVLIWELRLTHYYSTCSTTDDNQGHWRFPRTQQLSSSISSQAERIYYNDCCKKCSLFLGASGL